MLLLRMALAVCPTIIASLHVGHLTEHAQSLGSSGCLLLIYLISERILVGCGSRIGAEAKQLAQAWGPQVS